MLAEFGDDPHRYRDAKARKNYAGTSPITRASGRTTVVLARYARNKRLADAVHQWAFCALTGSPGARAYYDGLRAREIGHHAALRQLGNRLVGILHGCLKTRTRYDETTAWAHHHHRRRLTSQHHGMSDQVSCARGDRRPGPLPRRRPPRRARRTGRLDDIRCPSAPW